MTEKFTNKKISPASSVKLEANQTVLQEKLKQDFSDCATIQNLNTNEFPGKEVFSIDVTNPEIWKSAGKEEQLLKYFGELSFIAFEPRDTTRVYNLQDSEIKKDATIDLAEVKEFQKILVIAEKEKILGFAGSLMIQKDNLKMSLLSLIVINPAQRGEPFSKFLNEKFLSQENIDAYGAITHTPAAIKALLNEGQRLGRISYFCGRKEGEWGTLGNKEEQNRMQFFDKIIRNNYKLEYGDRCISDIPGYCGIKKLNQPGVIDPIPPVKEEELKFGGNSLLGQTFRNGLLKMNEKHKPHTIYGVYVSFKKDKIIDKQ